MGPLEGIRVVELAGLGPGPFAAMMLGDLGADVIRVDRIGGHFMNPEPRKNTHNRSRRSVALDLKNPDGIEAALKLIDAADALIEGFRPGVMERLGLGPEVCLERNPKLVYGRMTGWGQDGPLAAAAGHDINYLAITGALHAIGTKESGPVPPLNMVADYGGGGMLLAYGLLAGIISAGRTGTGQVVDAAMTDGVPLLLGGALSRLAMGAWRDEREANMLDGGAYYYGTYECADGQWISIGSIEPRFHKLLLEKLDLTDAPEFADQHNPETWPAARAKLAEVFKSEPRAHWCELMENTDVCFGPVLSMTDAPHHPHNRARGTYIEIEDTWQGAPAPRFSATPADTPTRPPLAGEHNDEALADWGFSADDIARLKDAGAL
ncbi:MAG: CaiB/BaiF CoA-transferase family protein [Magnetovibrio sp.]|nr:CaiB/BaiF CoA-transferase family protein [Magnetovibrio sp.]